MSKTQGGGVLGYISDGDVRRPFLGLKFSAWDFFGFEIFWWTFFALKILARTFLGVDENRALPFLILRKTISPTSLNHANKMTRQRQLSLFCTFIVFDA